MMCNGSKLASVQVGVSGALGQDVSEGLRSFLLFDHRSAVCASTPKLWPHP